MYIKKIGMFMLALIGVAAMTGCSSVNPVYRTYYQDSQCKIFYVDANGQRVYDWKTSGDKAMVGRHLCRDSNGRLYYQDSWGNRIYQQRMCVGK